MHLAPGYIHVSHCQAGVSHFCHTLCTHSCQLLTARACVADACLMSSRQLVCTAACCFCMRLCAICDKLNCLKALSFCLLVQFVCLNPPWLGAEATIRLQGGRFRFVLSLTRLHRCAARIGFQVGSLMTVRKRNTAPTCPLSLKTLSGSSYNSSWKPLPLTRLYVPYTCTYTSMYNGCIKSMLASYGSSSPFLEHATDCHILCCASIALHASLPTSSALAILVHKGSPFPRFNMPESTRALC